MYRIQHLSEKLDDVIRSFRYCDNADNLNVDSSFKRLRNTNIKDSLFYRQTVEKISPDNSEKDQKILHSMADSILNKDSNNVYNSDDKMMYWIIDKVWHKVYGPYSEIGFLKERDRLDIGNLSLEG